MFGKNVTVKLILLSFAELILLSYTQVYAKKVLIAGDSMGEYSAKLLATYCSGVTVYNAAIGGTKASQWTGTGLADYAGSTSCGGTVDYIWLTVGGNDFLETQCCDTCDKATVAAVITSAIDTLVAKVPNAKILMVGYPMANGLEMGDRRLGVGNESSSEAHPRRLPCSTPAGFDNIGQAVKLAAEAHSSVTFVDSTELFGGSSSAWSPKRYHADAIHLNNQGYCKLFTMPAVQTFFGCGSATHDCDSLTCAVSGYSSCGDGEQTECSTCSEYCVQGPSPTSNSPPPPSPTPSPPGNIDGSSVMNTWLMVVVVMARLSSPL